MIHVKNGAVFEQGTALLKDISLHVQPQDFFCLVGESGGGKTLLCQLILGLLPEHLQGTGKLQVDRSRMELILQDPLGSMQPNCRVGQQFHQLLRSKGVKQKTLRNQKIVAALSWVGFEEPVEILSKRPFELSGGMCQKVAIAMALVSEPAVLIADEPTSALDADSQAMILDVLWRCHVEKQLTVLLITHDLTLVKKYGHQVGIMQGGRLVEQGTVAAVLNTPQHTYTQELVAIFDA